MTAVNVYRDGKVYVRGERCDHCLFSPRRLVSAARARDIVEATRADAGPFVCHRHQISDEPESICHVWYERFGSEVVELRIAEIIGIVERVQP